MSDREKDMSNLRQRGTLLEENIKLKKEQKAMNEKIDDCLNTFDEYDRKLFQLYYETGLSIRRLSEETGITFKSIQYTIDKVKNNIKKLI